MAVQSWIRANRRAFLALSAANLATHTAVAEVAVATSGCDGSLCTLTSDQWQSVRPECPLSSSSTISWASSSALAGAQSWAGRSSVGARGEIVGSMCGVKKDALKESGGRCHTSKALE